ncbi:MAG: hypothetical protein SO159_05280, partial [Dialister sp.]|nr:hypothetical protein [Dialister sp.]
SDGRQPISAMSWLMQIGWHRDDFVPWREEVFLFVLVCVTGDWARQRFYVSQSPISKTLRRFLFLCAAPPS